mgnify:CR=1 FL=1
MTPEKRQRRLRKAIRWLVLLSVAAFTGDDFDGGFVDEFHGAHIIERAQCPGDKTKALPSGQGF